jgi:hypothetical protein
MTIEGSPDDGMCSTLHTEGAVRHPNRVVVLTAEDTEELLAGRIESHGHVLPVPTVATQGGPFERSLLCSDTPNADSEKLKVLARIEVDVLDVDVRVVHERLHVNRCGTRAGPTRTGNRGTGLPISAASRVPPV